METEPIKIGEKMPSKGSELPAEVKGWSWGAFLLNWIWAIGNKTWWGLLALVPYLGFFVALFLGFKGRELAWKNNDWESYEHFDAIQRRWSFWGVLIVGGSLILGVLLAVALPAYQDYKKTLGLPAGKVSENSEQSLAKAEDYGFGIKTQEQYQNVIQDYRNKIKSNEVHVFDASPIVYLSDGDLPWPSEEVKKLNSLWWYENDDIYLVISNHYPRLAINKIMLGINWGRCGTIDQTQYLINLNMRIEPGFYAIVKIKNQALHDFAYKTYGNLNHEEQTRWGSGRNDMNDCININNAWSQPN